MKMEVDFSSPMWLDLGDYQESLATALTALRQIGASQRIWGRDGTLWKSTTKAAHQIESRLGWLELPREMPIEVSRISALSLELRASGIEQIVLLGMGGSSLAAEVMRHIFGMAAGHPDLTVLDSTDPAQVRRVAHGLSLSRALFLVASKSGTTAETMALYNYFRAAVRDQVGQSWPEHFIAITDPGTDLEALARESGFRNAYLNPPDVGGRYSALSLFGLVPAALIGIDLDKLLQRARSMAWDCRSTAPVEANPGLVLGAIMGELARHPSRPRDKLVLLTSPDLAPFGAWAEQLIAESTGKEGVGILPVTDESLTPQTMRNSDRLYVYLRLATADNTGHDALINSLTQAGQPTVVLRVNDIYALGAEFFRWEFATAVAGQRLGINPFDQPDVDHAKAQARQALVRYEETQSLPEASPVLLEGALSLYGPGPDAQSISEYLHAFLAQAKPGDYVALMAYIERNEDNNAALQSIRHFVSDRLGLAVTVGFGPRFLHSTGQLHKGGPNSGLFVQITQDDTEDLPIPERNYSFGILKRAQALGDLEALLRAGRRVVRVHVGSDVVVGLRALSTAFRGALG